MAAVYAERELLGDSVISV